MTKIVDIHKYKLYKKIVKELEAINKKLLDSEELLNQFQHYKAISELTPKIRKTIEDFENVMSQCEAELRKMGI